MPGHTSLPQWLPRYVLEPSPGPRTGDSLALVFCWFAPQMAQNHGETNVLQLLFQCFPWIRLGPVVGRVLRARNAEGIN